MPESQEASIGRDNHAKILAEFGGAYDDPALQAYVTGVGKKVAATSEKSSLDFRFTILDSPIVNAFAMPGGYVYVTRGLLALASSEAELAGVLGHEIGHVTARHMAQRYSQAMLAQIGLLGLGMATGSSTVTELAGAGAAVYLQSFSREEEFEADLLGVRYISRAAYDPQGMGSFLDKMLMNSRLDAEIAGKPGAADQFDIMATHPRTADRVQRAVAEAATQPVPNPAVGGNTYLAKIDGLLYGDDPKQGFIRDRQFLHPVLRLAFTAPAGFRLMNGSDQVTGTGPQKGLAFAFDRDPRTPGDLAAYLTQQWAPKLDLQDVESRTVSGLPAATARARASTRSGPVEVRLAAIRLGDATYRFLFLATPALAAALDDGFNQTVASFRRLSAAEAAALKPQRIKIVTVMAGDTIAGLGGRMPFPDYREEPFRVLNGLGPDSQIKPGQRVKIVVQ